MRKVEKVWNPPTHVEPDFGIEIATRVWLHEHLGHIFVRNGWSAYMLVSTETHGDGTLSIRMRNRRGDLWKLSQVVFDGLLKSSALKESTMAPWG